MLKIKKVNTIESEAKRFGSTHAFFPSLKTT